MEGNIHPSSVDPVLPLESGVRRDGGIGGNTSLTWTSPGHRSGSCAGSARLEGNCCCLGVVDYVTDALASDRRAGDVRRKPGRPGRRLLAEARIWSRHVTGGRIKLKFSVRTSVL
jgi:hypothetical protein